MSEVNEATILASVIANLRTFQPNGWSFVDSDIEINDLAVRGVLAHSSGAKKLFLFRMGGTQAEVDLIPERMQQIWRKVSGLSVALASFADSVRKAAA